MKQSAKRKVSRRRFLALGSLTLAGLWAGASNQMGARAVRGLVSETTRPILPPDFIPFPDFWLPEGITAAWVGHSTVLINFYGLTLLTDPVLQNRIGADTFLGTIGPKRLIAPALTATQLPPIDAVLVSHAHMDHLHPSTLRALPGAPQVVSAAETTDLFQATGLRQVRCLRWGETLTLNTPKGELQIQAFEVRHWGARWRFDTHRGYNGYILSRGGKKILFGGDTALTDSFRALRQKGPFELAIMPIGAYQPWITAHCTPEQAVQMANAAGASHFAPVHFKTFPFGREATAEPLQRLRACLDPERLAWSDIGQTFRIV